MLIPNACAAEHHERPHRAGLEEREVDDVVNEEDGERDEDAAIDPRGGAVVELLAVERAERDDDQADEDEREVEETFERFEEIHQPPGARSTEVRKLSVMPSVAIQESCLSGVDRVWMPLGAAYDSTELVEVRSGRPWGRPWGLMVSVICRRVRSHHIHASHAIARMRPTMPSSVAKRTRRLWGSLISSAAIGSRTARYASPKLFQPTPRIGCIVKSRAEPIQYRQRNVRLSWMRSPRGEAERDERAGADEDQRDRRDEHELAMSRDPFPEEGERDERRSSRGSALRTRCAIA